VDDADLDLADGDHVAVLDRVVVVLGLGEGVDRDACAVLERQAAMSRDVVGVVVRLDDADDLHAVPLGFGDVLLDRVRGIDDDRLARGVGADQVRRAPEVGVDKLSKDHLERTLMRGISDSYQRAASTTLAACPASFLEVSESLFFRQDALTCPR
jgi:hypothetical protein